MAEPLTISGGCHCGAVQFEARVEQGSEVQSCNCSMCRMCGFQHLIVPASRFRLKSGEKRLQEYRFRTGTARHLFCRRCGVKSFYVPRSNPDGYSLNVRCLNLPSELELEFTAFDGKNWSKNAESLRHLSQDKPSS